MSYWKIRSKQMPADTTYFLQVIVHKPSLPAFDNGVNALNLVLQTLLMFSKSTSPYVLTQPQFKYLL